MKKLLVVALVLAIAASANAGLTLSASSTNLTPDQTAVVQIMDDAAAALDSDYYLGISGPGSLNIDNVTTEYCGDVFIVDWVNDQEVADFLGIQNPFVNIEIADYPGPPDPSGFPYKLADNIVFTCEGWGNVTIKLFDGESNPVDSLTITQPEPATLVLLGIGALLLRRKSKI